MPSDDEQRKLAADAALRAGEVLSLLGDVLVERLAAKGARTGAEAVAQVAALQAWSAALSEKLDDATRAAARTVEKELGPAAKTALAE